MSVLDQIAEELGLLEEHGALRLPDLALDPPDAGWIDVSSNDYLGLAGHPVSRETLNRLSGVPTGAAASRLIYGTRPEHLALEKLIASWVRRPAALVFTSGFAANVGCLSALVGPDDLIVSDALNHASLIDGCRLSRAQVRIVAHRDCEAVKGALSEPARRKWVVTESYFSMDGDSPDLPELRRLCDRAGAGLIVDEAHALGVFGPEGAGICAQHGVVPEALIGTLGKAVGVQGAFVAGSLILRTYLWNRARSFVFSTALSPLLAAVTAERIETVRRSDALRTHVWELCKLLERRLLEGGVHLQSQRHGPIFPILFGTNERAMEVAASLRARGFLAQAIRPPTVPRGTSRLRVTLHASLTAQQVTALADLLVHQCSAG